MLITPAPPPLEVALSGDVVVLNIKIYNKMIKIIKNDNKI